jgi:hypothetical protein
VADKPSKVSRDVAAARLARLTDVVGAVEASDTASLVEHVRGVSSLKERREASARLARLEDRQGGHR